jgi:hypothetical protein
LIDQVCIQEILPPEEYPYQFRIFNDNSSEFRRLDYRELIVASLQLRPKFYITEPTESKLSQNSLKPLTIGNAAEHTGLGALDGVFS